MRDIKVTDVRVHPGDGAFLIDDGETAVLYDTGFAFTGYGVADNVKKALGDRNLEYIFLTHSHYDHALGSAYVSRVWPDVKVVAGEYAAKILQKPTAREAMRDLDRKIAKKAGVDEYEDLIDELKVDIVVKDGDIIHAGKMDFQVIELPGHTKCSIAFYLAENKLLLGSETLGNYDGVDTIIPAYLVGYQITLDSIDKAKKLDIENVLIPHFGLMDKEQTKYYLSAIKSSTIEVAEAFVEMLKAGKSDDEIREYYRSRYYNSRIKESYPEDAMELNTGIMINLIRRECM